MYEDILDKPKPKVIAIISCRKCGSVHVDSTGKKAVGAVLTSTY